mmetsp:Transcript_23729/g.54364  ORF Transcript_23729/g.54364 Transcript_23729/m.54364 type:complete len:90 (+) Transcript_23729:832-1101(+)
MGMAEIPVQPRAKRKRMMALVWANLFILRACVLMCDFGPAWTSERFVEAPTTSAAVVSPSTVAARRGPQQHEQPPPRAAAIEVTGGGAL